MILEVYGESVVTSSTSYSTNDFEFDGFDGVKDLMEAGEGIVSDYLDIVKECEDDQSMMEVHNIVQEYTFLKENGYELIHEENKFTEFFKKIGDTIKKWLDKIMDFIERFIDKITNKINGVDALRSIRNPVYAGSEFKDFNIQTYIGNKDGMGKDNFLPASTMDEVVTAFSGAGEGADAVKEARKAIDNAIKKLVKDKTDLDNKSTLSAKDIVANLKGGDDKQVTYGKGDGKGGGGENVPSLTELLKIVDGYVDAKQNAKRLKAECKKEANELLKETKKAEAKTARANRVEGFMSAYSSAIAKINSFNSAVCAGELLWLKEVRLLAIRLAKGYKEKKAEKAK